MKIREYLCLLNIKISTSIRNEMPSNLDRTQTTSWAIIQEYINNWPLQLFSHDYGIVSLFYLCVTAGLFYSQNFCRKSAERKWISKQIFFFFFINRFYTWPGARTRALRLISDFIIQKYYSKNLMLADSCISIRRWLLVRDIR